ncbi:hypothetical protein B1B_07968, partial [mine drainage metagenome]
MFGGAVGALQIGIRPESLARFDLGFNDVLEAARRAGGVRGAGFIETPNQRLVLDPEGQALTEADLAGRLVAMQGAGRVTLGDVADI